MKEKNIVIRCSLSHGCMIANDVIAGRHLSLSLLAMILEMNESVRYCLSFVVLWMMMFIRIHGVCSPLCTSDVRLDTNLFKKGTGLLSRFFHISPSISGFVLSIVLFSTFPLCPLVPYHLAATNSLVSLSIATTTHYQSCQHPVFI